MRHRTVHWTNARFGSLYAVFCMLRYQYGTVGFHALGQVDAHYSSARWVMPCLTLFAHPQFNEVMHCFVQYYLHLQLVSAVNYFTSAFYVSLKGDLPIGVRRHSVDTGRTAVVRHGFSLSAPPDMFSDLGQKSGSYQRRMARMRADDYGWCGVSAWPRYRKHFDAMRIDHVLGFFRIWRISSEATQGLLGYFYPAWA